MLESMVGLRRTWIVLCDLWWCCRSLSWALKKYRITGGVCPGTLKGGVCGTVTKPKMGSQELAQSARGRGLTKGCTKYSDTYKLNIPTSQYSDTTFGLGFGYATIVITCVVGFEGHSMAGTVLWCRSIATGCSGRQGDRVMCLPPLTVAPGRATREVFTPIWGGVILHLYDILGTLSSDYVAGRLFPGYVTFISDLLWHLQYGMPLALFVS